MSQSDLITVPPQINGLEHPSDTVYPVVAPNTIDTCWYYAAADRNKALEAVSAAEAAFPQWSATKPAARRAIFLKAADILDSRAEEYGKFMQTEIGATVGFLQHYNVPKCADMLRDIAGRMVTLAGSVPECAEGDRSAVVLKVPYGVVLGIAPW